MVRNFRCVGGSLTRIGPQVLATPGVRRIISVPLLAILTAQAEKDKPYFSSSAPGPVLSPHGAEQGPGLAVYKSSMDR